MLKLNYMIVLLLITVFTSSLIAADPVAVIIKAKGDITIKNTTSGKSQ